MAIPERDTVYTPPGTTRTEPTPVYTRESNATGWFVGIIVALALLAIGYLVFSANTPSTTSVDITTSPAVTTPAPADTAIPAPADTTAPAPMVEAPAPAPAPAPQPVPAPAPAPAQ